MKRVIVTGAAGFIGANVARRLLADGYETTLLTVPGVRLLAPCRGRGGRPHAPARPRDADAVARSSRPGGPSGSSTSPPTAPTRGSGPRRDSPRRTSSARRTCSSRATRRRGGVRQRGLRSEYGLKDHAPPRTSRPSPTAPTRSPRRPRRCSASRRRADGLNVCTLRLYSAYGPWEEPKRLVPALRARASTADCRRWWPPRRRATSSRSTTSSTRTCRRERCTPSAGAVYNVGSGTQTTLASGRDRPRASRDRGSRPGDRCRRGCGTPTAGLPTAVRSAIASAGGLRAPSVKDSRSSHRGSGHNRTSSPITPAPVLDSLANRTNFALARTEGWRPPLHSPPTTLVRRWLAALRRLIDLQAGSIWRDLAGELAAVDGLVVDVGCGAQPYRQLLGPSARYVGIDTADAKADFGYEIPDTLYFDGDSWPVDSESANVVLCTETLEQFSSPRSSPRGAPYAPSRGKASREVPSRPVGTSFRTIIGASRRRACATCWRQRGSPTSPSMHAEMPSRWRVTRQSRSCFVPLPQRDGVGARRAAARAARSPVRRLPRAGRSCVSPREGRRGLSGLHRHRRPSVMLVFEDRLCPLCGSAANSRLFAEARFDPSRLDAMSFSSRKTPEGMHHRLLECTGCDLLYASPVPTFDSIVDAYRDAAYESGEEARYAAATYASLVGRIEGNSPTCGVRPTSVRVTARSFTSCRRLGSTGRWGSSPRLRPWMRRRPMSGR